MFRLKLSIIVPLLFFLSSSDCKNTSDYRLSDNHIPTNYVLRLTIDPDADKFNGEVQISFSTKNETHTIQLHASTEYLTINEIVFNGNHYCNVSNHDKETNIASIACPVPITKSKYNQVAIKFSGIYAEYNGLCKGHYVYKNITENVISSQFESTWARSAFPCFDEPQLKAQFDVMVIHPKNYTALFNSPITYRIFEDPYVFTKFKKTTVMSTYLLAFVVSKLSKKDSSTSETRPFSFPITIHYRPDLENNTRTALQYGGDLIHAHSTFTGISYDELGDSKMDFVGLPYFGGAMENWGLIIFGEVALLDDADKTTPEHKQYIILTMAHELAHQWFGDYVTLDWWSDVWLNEGFANFFEMHFDEKLVGVEMELERQFVPTVLHGALEYDEISVYPISSKNEEIFKQKDIDGKFDGVSYDKGASVIRMMRAILGKANFQKGIQKYMQQNGHKTAVASLLLNTLGSFYNSSNRSFEERLHNWIYVRGYPLVNVSLNPGGKSVQIKQEVFTGNSQWDIPISYTTSKEKNFDVRVDNWLLDKPLNIQLEENSWFIVNLQQTGFFRVNYDTALWERIIAVLKSEEMKNIHVSNRAQLLDDAFILAERKKLSNNVTFALAEYVRRESEYEPWAVIKKRITNIIRNLEQHNQKEAALKIKNLTLGWIHEAFPDTNPNLTTHLQQLTHNLIMDFKAYLGDKESLRQAQIIYKQNILKKNIQDYDITKMALCYGLMLSATPETDFDILLRYYKETESSFKRKEIISSLGCANSPQMLKMYLSEVLSENTKILKVDINDVFKAVYSNHKYGLEVFFNFLDENVEKLTEKYGEILKLNDLIWNSARTAVTKEQLLKVEKIIMKYQHITNMREVGAEAFFKVLSNQITRKSENVEDILTVLRSQ